MTSVHVDEKTFAILETVTNAAQSLGIKWMVTGAAGRVMLLEGVYGLPHGRATQDMDLGVMVASWDEYQALNAQIMQDTRFHPDPKQRQRLRFMNDGLLDLVPFGAIESKNRSIVWPPENAVAMSVLGFREAYTDIIQVDVNGLTVPIVSPVGLMLLKLVAWHERRTEQPKKDAADLAYVLRHYAKILSEPVLFEQHFTVVEAAGFDIDLAASRVLGQKIAQLAAQDTRAFVKALLEEQLVQGTDSILVREIGEQLAGDIERTYALLQALQAGFLEVVTQ